MPDVVGLREGSGAKGGTGGVVINGDANVFGAICCTNDVARASVKIQENRITLTNAITIGVGGIGVLESEETGFDIRGGISKGIEESEGIAEVGACSWGAIGADV